MAKTMSLMMLWLSAVLFSPVHAAHGPSTKVHDHSMGVHGMVLVKAGDHLLASHLPLHGSKHAHQIIMEVEIDSLSASVATALQHNQMVTLAPETFSLNRLQSGELSQFQAVVYLGHFERGGEPQPTPVTVRVLKRLLMQPLQSVENGRFYWLELDKLNGLLVHRIGGLPSFDQLLWLTRDKLAADDAVDGRTGDSAGEEQPLVLPLMQLSDGRPLTATMLASKQFPWHWKAQLYLETQDFQLAE